MSTDAESLPHMDVEKTEPTLMAREVRVDEVQPHVPYLNASKGDSPYIHPDSDRIEADEATALSMAEAGRRQRQVAAGNRGRLRFMGEYEDAYWQALEGGRFGRKKRLERLYFDDPRFDHIHGPLDRIDMKLDVERAFTTPRGREMLTEMQNRLAEEARQADERAEREEAWAKAFHEHPVSEEYKKAHPGIKFGPHSLAHVEDWLSYDDELSAGLKKEAESVSKEGVVNAARRIEDEFFMMEPDVPREEIDEFIARYDALNEAQTTNPHEYFRLCWDILQTHAKYLEEEVQEKRRVLDDVRSGRASRPPEPESPPHAPVAYDEETGQE